VSDEVWLTPIEIISFGDNITLLVMTAAIWRSLSQA